MSHLLDSDPIVSFTNGRQDAVALVEWALSLGAALSVITSLVTRDRHFQRIPGLAIYP